MGEVVRGLVDWLIEEGIKSVHRHETRPERIRGCLSGFEIARGIPPSLEAYEAVLAERHAEEMRMVRESSLADIYWEYRCATGQIEHIYARLEVCLGAGRMSAMAVMHIAEYVRKLAREAAGDAKEALGG